MSTKLYNKKNLYSSFACSFVFEEANLSKEKFSKLIFKAMIISSNSDQYTCRALIKTSARKSYQWY